MFKIALLLILAMAPMVLYAGEHTLELNGASYHYNAEDEEYNELNLGLGYTYRQVSHTLNNQLSVGYYKNSYQEDSLYLLGGKYLELPHELKMGLVLGIATGYGEETNDDLKCTESSHVLCIAALTLSYKRLNAIVTPSVLTVNVTVFEW